MTSIPTILYDADCRLCTGSVAFIRRHAPDEAFVYLSLNSPEAMLLLADGPLPGQSIVLLDDEGRHEQSTAVLRIAAGLRRPWSWARWLRILPRSLRDTLYRWVARNRIRWFGTNSPD